jgi:superfamily II DNA/RNA helicase
VPDWVRTTATRHLRNPASVRVEPTGSVAPSIEHMVYEVGDGERLPALRALLDERGTGTTLVFGRTKHGVKALCRRLETLGYPVAALQGNLSQNARDRVVAEVRAGRVPILLATNVAARGIDIDHIERVINYELPETPELFTHRVGRTGRMGRHGAAITLLGPDDMARWRQFERALGHALPRATWPSGQVAAAQPRRAVAAGARPAASATGRGVPAAQPRRAAAAPRPIAAAPRSTTMPARPSGPSHGPQPRPAAGPIASRRRRSRYHGARPAAVGAGRRG